ncbi:MAG: hypothetical protein QGG56_00785 [Dehalococcoidia bacterium]|nr:hypothetical protein [Dehalococcoidia bacterium]
MPRREEERGRPSSLRYCVFCQRYMSVDEWETHPHNPEVGRGLGRRLRRALVTVIVVLVAVTIVFGFLLSVLQPN